LEPSSWRRKRETLLARFAERVLPSGAEDVVAVLDLVDTRRQLAAETPLEPDAEDLAAAVGGQPPEADLAASLEDFVDGEMAFADEVPAGFDRSDGVPGHGDVEGAPRFHALADAIDAVGAALLPAA
jgi:hypothetical protein